ACTASRPFFRLAACTLPASPSASSTSGRGDGPCSASRAPASFSVASSSCGGPSRENLDRAALLARAASGDDRADPHAGGGASELDGLGAGLRRRRAFPRQSRGSAGGVCAGAVGGGPGGPVP